MDSPRQCPGMRRRAAERCSAEGSSNMTTTAYSREAAEGLEGLHRLTGREVAKFGVMVGFFGIFYDAALAHGLFWENDPYWTYWITKTFLITTVFSLGTVFLGIGIWQGLALTFVHTLVLEIYYQWFAPIGLPQEPQWLSIKEIGRASCRERG